MMFDDYPDIPEGFIEMPKQNPNVKQDHTKNAKQEKEMSKLW